MTKIMLKCVYIGENNLLHVRNDNNITVPVRLCLQNPHLITIK